MILKVIIVLHFQYYCIWIKTKRSILLNCMILFHLQYPRIEFKTIVSTLLNYMLLFDLQYQRMESKTKSLEDEISSLRQQLDDAKNDVSMWVFMIGRKISQAVLI